MMPASNGAVVAPVFFFYLLSGIAILGGLAMITRRNAVHSALALIVTLLAIANLYLMLYAPFVAGVQIVVYAGGIMVLFLFVIMLVNLERTVRDRRFNRMWPVGLVASCALLAIFLGAYKKGQDLFPEPKQQLLEATNTQQIGSLLYGNYMFAFEIASLLLLVAILGAVIMAKKRI